MQLDNGFRDRMKWAIEMANSNQSAVARACGIKPQSVQAWVSGATADPSRTHLEQAAAYLGVQYEWLVWGKGPMRLGDVDPRTRTAVTGPTSEQVLLGREWDSRLASALDHTELPEHVATGHWVRIRLTWMSDRVAVLRALYLAPGSVISAARIRLWTLDVARALTPLVPDRRWVLLLAPLADAAVSEGALDTVRQEARALGIEVIHVHSPEQAAAVLLGRDHLTQAPAPVFDDADISDVII